LPSGDVRAPRRLDLHQCREPVHFGFRRHELGDDSPEAQRVLAERRANPVVAGRRRISLIENQIDDLQHRGEPRRELGVARHFVRHFRCRERLLRADDALRDRRFRCEECAGDLARRQAAKQSQRQRDARFGGEHRVTGGEDEAQQVIANLVVERGVDVERRTFIELASDLLVLVIGE